MLREEAIRKTLDTVLWTRNASDDNKNILTDALIKALEQEPVLDKIRAEIENYDNFILCANGQKGIHIDKALEIIDKYRAESEDKK